jgi:hypothetical protein
VMNSPFASGITGHDYETSGLKPRHLEKTSTGMPEGVPFPKIDRLLDDLERIALARSMARGT